MKNCSIKRRKFLKTGIGIAVLCFVPKKKLFSQSDRIESDGCVAGQSQEKVYKIVLEYGGEFAQIKPELRRNNNGNI